MQISGTVFQIFRPLLERFGGTFDYRIISRLVNAIHHKENRRIRRAVYCRHLKNKIHYILLLILRQSTVNLPCSGCEDVCGNGGVTPFIHKLHQMEVNGHLHMLDSWLIGREMLVPIEWEAMWAPDLVWTLKKKKNCLTLAEFNPQFLSRTTHSLVITSCAVHVNVSHFNLCITVHSYWLMCYVWNCIHYAIIVNR